MVYSEDFDEFEDLPIKNAPKERKIPWNKRKPNRAPKRSEEEILAGLVDDVDELADLPFTYQASRHERAWIVNALNRYYDQRWILDVLRLVKGGKEASVYLCAGNPGITDQHIAAKIYRPRRFRQLKNDQLYREGRERLDSEGHVILDGGKQHAMNKRTSYGLDLLHTSWIEHEYRTLRIIYQAGCDVPIPFASGENTILMSYIGEEGLAAPTLNTIELQTSEARQLFERVNHNIELMLAHERVHGDLSAFNVLYWKGEITLIDFPQAISPKENRNAFRIFERDVMRISEYFARQGVPVNAVKLAADLWTVYKYRIKPDFDLRLLDPEDAGDRAYWEGLQD